MWSVARRFSLALITLLALGSTIVAQAAIIDVPSQQPTIQAAINAAQNGDTIAVAPGTYNEDLDFIGKAIALVGTAGASKTILVGAGSSRVLAFATGEGRSTSVSGFTLRTGAYPGAEIVFAFHASPSFSDDIFDSAAGTVIQAKNSSLLLQRSLVIGSTCGGGAYSAAVYLADGEQNGSATIKNNVFLNNHCIALSVPLLSTSSADVSNNTFAGNDIGIYTIGNISEHAIVLRNNILYANRLGISIYNLTNAANMPTQQNNLVYGNTTDYDGLQEQTGSNGNISADPRLGGLVVGDVHPDSGSPVIDAGINAAVDAQATDFYGMQRIRAGSSGLPIVDIGAAEYVGNSPSVTLKASATAVPLGSSVTLTWNAVGANTCTATGAWGGALSLSGARQIAPPVGASTYTIACSNSAASRGQTITVVAVPPPTVQLAVLHTLIIENSQDSIWWTSTDAPSCTKSGAWSGAAANAGSEGLLLTRGTYNYTMTCTGIGGSASASVQVRVVPLPKISMQFSQTDVPLGGTTVLTWTATDATSCTASGAWSGPQPLTGSLAVNVTVAGAIASYGLECFGSDGQSSTANAGYISYTPAPAYSWASLAELPATVQSFALPSSGSPQSGGLDGHGYAYDAEYFFGSLNWADQMFYVSNYTGISGLTRQTVSLPAMHLAALSFLATGVAGNQLNQSFVVTYTDGTTTTYTQSLSDWRIQQNYPGEDVALVVPYRVTPTGAVQAGRWHIYGYRMTLDPNKTVKSLTLPKNRNVVVLAINLNTLPQPFVASLASLSNVTAIALPGNPAANAGLDGHGYAYDGSSISSELKVNGYDFVLGSPNTASGVTKAVIPLSNKTVSLTILATAVYGSQANQSFVVTYSDNTTTVFTQSMSDWGKAQQFPGESVAATASYRIIPAGTRQQGPWKIYSYTFMLDSRRGIKSLTLPNNRNVIVLGVGQQIVN